MTTPLRVFLCLLAVSGATATPAPAQESSRAPSAAIAIQGPVQAFNDGDTFVVRGFSIRLKGIDAPETAQTCRDGRDRSYPCGDHAANHLVDLVGGDEVHCQGEEKDEYDRLIAYCRAGGRDLNRAMVRDGWAVAFVRFDDSYVAEEEAARAARRGIWAGEFQRPEDFRAAGWRRANRRSGGGEDGECPIKGNINAKGDRIYHTPWGSKHYRRTRINTSRGERWFCSEAEALAAGWRPPIR